MRIFLDNSGYYLNNVGDVAMLQTAVTRLHALWPEAYIDVVTDNPQRLAELCPGTRAVSAAGRFAWFARGSLLGILGRYAHRLGAMGRYIQRQERHLRYARPDLARTVIVARKRGKSLDVTQAREFSEALYAADFVVASGGGYITDTFQLHALCVLDTMRLAHQLGKPTAMLGQGIGPITSRDLLAGAGATLPEVGLITLREGKIGPPLLKELHVSSERVAATGDDAIEMAYSARPEVLGESIGVNLRIAHYSEVASELIPLLRTTLKEIEREFVTELLPVPIAFAEQESDVATISQLLAWEGEQNGESERLQNPGAIIRQVSRCRVVITGSYHAAVFALSQGIPVVGLVKSAYYDHKFIGLAYQFGVGCAWLHLDADDFPVLLMNAVRNAWELAPQIRPQLLAAAEQQIAAGQEAYLRLPSLLQ